MLRAAISIERRLIALVPAHDCSPGCGGMGSFPITVERTPDTVVVGEPVTVTYAVRQHGQRLLSGLQGRIEARLAGNGHPRHRHRPPRREDGHYAATLTLPRPGTWTLDIVSGFNSSTGHAAPCAPSPPSAAQAPALSPSCTRWPTLRWPRGAPRATSREWHPRHRHSANRDTTPQYYLRQFLRRPPVRAEERIADARPSPRGGRDRRAGGVPQRATFVRDTRGAGREFPPAQTALNRSRSRYVSNADMRRDPSERSGDTFLEDATSRQLRQPPRLDQPVVWRTIVFTPGGPGFVTADGSLE